MAEFIFGSSECLKNITIDNVASYFTYPEVGIKVFETKYFKCCTLVNRYSVFKEYSALELHWYIRFNFYMS